MKSWSEKSNESARNGWKSRGDCGEEEEENDRRHLRIEVFVAAKPLRNVSKAAQAATMP
jgi:hypothetical protein